MSASVPSDAWPSNVGVALIDSRVSAILLYGMVHVGLRFIWVSSKLVMLYVQSMAHAPL